MGHCCPWTHSTSGQPNTPWGQMVSPPCRPRCPPMWDTPIVSNSAPTKPFRRAPGRCGSTDRWHSMLRTSSGFPSVWRCQQATTTGSGRYGFPPPMAGLCRSPASSTTSRVWIPMAMARPMDLRRWPDWGSRRRNWGNWPRFIPQEPRCGGCRSPTSPPGTATGPMDRQLVPFLPLLRCHRRNLPAQLPIPIRTAAR